MITYNGPPPMKKSRCEKEEYGYSSGSDDSFNDPVLDGPSQITQNYLQRTSVEPTVELQQQLARNSAVSSSQIHGSPPGRFKDPDNKTWKSFPRQACSVTPGRFSVQEKNDYHQNGQLLMLRNRVENMEREKERLAAATRDQIILKEKQHAADLLKKDEQIRQLETQVRNLRRENLQTSFQAHNVSLLGSTNSEVVDAGNFAAPLPLKKVVFSRNDSVWKTGSKFGVGSSVFCSSSLSDRFEGEARLETFTHMPSQVLIEEPAIRNRKSIEPLSLSSSKNTHVLNENKECQASAVDECWDVRKWMCELSLETLLRMSLLSQENNFDLSALSRLCQKEDFFDLKSCLR